MGLGCAWLLPNLGIVGLFVMMHGQAFALRCLCRIGACFVLFVVADDVVFRWPVLRKMCVQAT